jgi:hypothetical protein
LSGNPAWAAIVNPVIARNEHTAMFNLLFKTLIKIMPLFNPEIHIQGAAAGRANVNLGGISSSYDEYLNRFEKPDPVISQLHWLDKPSIDGEAPFEPSQVKSVSVGPIASHLNLIGRMRFDTIFVRNLVFIVNLYRTVRHKLQKDLTYNRDIVASSQIITKPSITEFSGNQTYAPPPSYSLHQRYRKYQY